MEVTLGVLAIAASILTYYLGKRDGRQQERERDKRQLKATLVEEYVALVRGGEASGVRALCRLGLDQLARNALIREAIDEMEARTGPDPWQSWREHIGDVDLVSWFRHVRENNLEVPYNNVSVEEVSRRVIEAEGRRRRSRFGLLRAR